MKNIKTLLVPGILVAALMLPAFTSASTIDDIKAQIDALLQQVLQLQQQIQQLQPSPTPSISPSPVPSPIPSPARPLGGQSRYH